MAQRRRSRSRNTRILQQQQECVCVQLAHLFRHSVPCCCCHEPCFILMLICHFHSNVTLKVRENLAWQHQRCIGGSSASQEKVAQAAMLRVVERISLLGILDTKGPLAFIKNAAPSKRSRLLESPPRSFLRREQHGFRLRA